MKFKLLSLLFFLGAASLSAQTEKGRWTIGLHNFSPVLQLEETPVQTSGLGIYFGNLKSESDFGEENVGVFELGLGASAGYFVANNFSIGLNLNTHYFKAEEDELEFKRSIFLIGPDVRYYLPVKQNLSVALHGGLEFGKLNQEFDNIDLDYNVLRLGLGAGIAYFISPNVSLDAGLGYDFMKLNLEIQGEDSDTKFSGLTVQLGFSLFFGKPAAIKPK